MKKLSVLIIFLFSFILSFGQLNPVTSGNNKTLYISRGGGQYQWLVITPADTLNNPTTLIKGAITLRPQDNKFYYSDGVIWHLWTGGGSPINDSIYVRLPLSIDSTTYPGHRILYLIHQDGLVSGGIVTWSGTGLIYNVPPADYFINGREFTSPYAQVTLTSDGTYPINYQFYVDTASSDGAIASTPVPNPPVPQVNPRYQIGLTSVGVTVNAGDTIPTNITSEIIYDEYDTTTEWKPSSTPLGSVLANYGSTANPYHLLKSIYVQTYNYGSLQFTKGSGYDTAYSGEVLSFWIYSNGAMFNPITVYFQSGSTVVSTVINLTSGNYGFNPALANTWQNVVIPFSGFSFTNGGIFNVLKIGLNGQDISLTKGLYIDYIRYVGGISNVNNISTIGGPITTIPVVGTNPGSNLTTFQWIQNTFYASQVPLATLTGGTILEFTSAGTVSDSVNWTASRQSATNPLSTIVVAGNTESFSQPSAGGTVSGKQYVTITANTNTTYNNVVTTTDGKTATASTSFPFENKIYAGFVSVSSPTDANIIAALNSTYVGGEFSTTRSQSGALTTPSGAKYIMFAAPASFGTPSVVINGLGVTFNQTTRTFVNASGYSSSYIIAVSPYTTAGSVDAYLIQ